MDFGEYKEDMPWDLKYELYCKIVADRQRVQGQNQ